MVEVATNCLGILFYLSLPAVTWWWLTEPPPAPWSTSYEKAQLRHEIDTLRGEVDELRSLSVGVPVRSAPAPWSPPVGGRLLGEEVRDLRGFVADLRDVRRELAGHGGSRRPAWDESGASDLLGSARRAALRQRVDGQLSGLARDLAELGGLSDRP